MDELLIWLIVGLFRLIRWIVLGLIRWVGSKLPSREGGGGNLRDRMRSTGTKVAATAARPTNRTAAVDDRPTQLAAIAKRARVLLSEERDRPASELFLPTLERIGTDADSARANLGKRTNQVIERLGLGLVVTEAMIAQRRDAQQLDALGDTDSLAAACYAPIVEHCDRAGIVLTSNRIATVIGQDKLFFMSWDDPSGLATIVLPESFPREIVWWPAIAHEVAHDFYCSVRGLGAELGEICGLSDDMKIPTGTQQLTMQDVGRAVSAWREELFCDAFGTMMLGPAYVRTMSWLFRSTDDPNRVVACDVADDGARYEEHPPGHVRVVAACRLLSLMGYGKEGDDLESEWRRVHEEPTTVILPTRLRRWIGIPEDVMCQRAAEVGAALYEAPFRALAGTPLRSIAGLDFGPREHELCRRVAEELMVGRKPQTRDPRMLIAGAVLAWLARPEVSRTIVTTVRERIEGIGAPRARRSVEWAAPEADAADDFASQLRDAVILDTLLSRPRGRL